MIQNNLIIKSNNKSDLNDRGFTIVELMIALSVLSTLLVMSTVILISIGALYAKGVNGANLQNATRNITSDVAASLQFSGSLPYPCTLNNPTFPTFQNSTTCSANVPALVNGPYAFCIGSTRYSYILNQELGLDNNGVQTSNVLWRDSMSNTNTCNPLRIDQSSVTGVPGDSADSNPQANGFEMMPAHMRLTRFEIYPASANSDIYKVNVWMAYGDQDLVHTQSMTSAIPGNTTCDGGPGTQFCAVSQLSTTVTGRVY